MGPCRHEAKAIGWASVDEAMSMTEVSAIVLVPMRCLLCGADVGRRWLNCSTHTGRGDLGTCAQHGTQPNLATREWKKRCLSYYGEDET